MQPPFSIASLVLAASVTLAHAADDDALDLEVSPTSPAAALDSGATPRLRVTLEAAAGLAQRPSGGGSDDGRRLSVDLRWGGKLADHWRFGLSNRLDDIHPILLGQRSTRNQLREAYLAWQPPTSQSTIELGRLNQRHGPAYGYNPTDFFRKGATRSVVTADPVALRENRSGTFMLRASQSWNGGSTSLAWAPQLTHSGRSDSTFALDLDATNASDRLLLTVNAKLSERWTAEALLLGEEGQSARLGLNLTGLASDAAVLHAEWSIGRSADLQAVALGTLAPRRQHHQQAAVGVTYTLPTGMSVTAEAAFNAAGLDRSGWRDVFAQGPAAVATLFSATQADQELASRRALLLYVSQKGLLLKQLDLTAFIRHNVVDHSGLAWMELRHHWPTFDAALQWQRGFGAQRTEFGALPYRQVIQLVGYFYF